MIIKNKKELEILREGGKRLAAVLIEVAWAAKDGVTTKELDELAEKLILKSRGKPSFKGYGAHRAPMPYPGTICISINEEVVHGIVSDRKLKNGDVVGLDIGMWYEGLCTDTAMTVLVGGGTNKLIETTKKSLKLGIAQVRPGAIDVYEKLIQLKQPYEKKIEIRDKLIGLHEVMGHIRDVERLRRMEFKDIPKVDFRPY